MSAPVPYGGRWCGETRYAALENEAFPYLACGRFTLRNGGSAQVYRVSFSGELAYEIAVPADAGEA